MIKPGRRPEPGKNPRKTFYAGAMKASGRVPGRGLVDGRKKAAGREMNDIQVHYRSSIDVLSFPAAPPGIEARAVSNASWL